MAAAAAAAAAASAPPAATATAAAAALAPASSRVLQWNVLGVAHMDPAARAVCEFLYRHANVPHLEVEAKLGTLESGGARFLLGILDDCVIDASRYSHPHFVPGVSAHVFRKLNELLGHRVKHLAGGVQERLRQLYRRREETDRLGQLPSGDQVREIRDKKSQAILQTQIKRVVDHLDFSNNAGPLDYRLSVKVEIPTRVDETVKWSKVREKNRVSYFIGIWSVDVTYVRTFKANEASGLAEGDPTETYEIEVELADSALLSNAKRKFDESGDDMFQSIAESLLDNMRTLADYGTGRLTLPMAPPPPVHAPNTSAQQRSGAQPSLATEAATIERPNEDQPAAKRAKASAPAST